MPVIPGALWGLDPICTGVFSISKNRGGVQCARFPLNSSGNAGSEVIVSKLAWNDLLEVIWWWAFDFFIYVNWKINNSDFLSGTQYSQKILIWEKCQVFNIQIALKSELFNIEPWNLTCMLVLSCSSTFVFYSIWSEIYFHFQKSRNLTLRAHHGGMVW